MPLEPDDRRPAAGEAATSLVETRGVEPVPASERTVGGWHLFQILVNTLLNPGLMMIGGAGVLSGLSPGAAVGAVVVGIIVAFGAYIVLATVGVDFGMPGIVSTRAFVGIAASRWIVSSIRAISSAFWFGVQTIAGALGIVAATNGLIGIELDFVAVCIVFGVLQLAVAAMGYGSLTWLSRVAFPVKIIGLPWIAIALMSSGGPQLGEVLGFNADSANQVGVFLASANTVAIAWLSQVTDAADYCRYSSSRRSMWVATGAAAIVGAGLSAAFGAFGAAWSQGASSNTFEVAGGADIGVVALIVLLVVLILENWTINVLNLYTGGLALNNLLPRWSRLSCTIVVGVAGIALACLPSLADTFTDAVSAAGLVFAPLAGVLLVDYLVIKRGHIDTSQLYARGGPYWYTGGWNLTAMAWVVVGAIAYVLLPDSTFPSLITIVLAGLGYYLTRRIADTSTPPRATTTASIMQEDQT